MCCGSATDADARFEVEGANRTLVPCSSQMLDNKHYDSSSIFKIVRLQRRMRAWLARSKAVNNYAELCPDKLEKADTDNVKVSDSC